MNTRIWNCSLIVIVIAVATGPSPLRAPSRCPGTISNGRIACHRMICEGCTNAWYNCDDGWDYNWSVCGL